VILLQRRLKAWLQLLRPPNLFTVPGDPIAGFILAGGGHADFRRAGALALTACLLYIAGLIWNDVADTREDTQMRPDRPIPSGCIKRGQAAFVAALLMLAGIALAWTVTPLSGLTAILLATLVLLYNFVARRWVLAGLLTMGLCRGFSVLLGATAVGPVAFNAHLPWLAAAGITLYIMAVSLVAHGETHRQPLGIKPWLPVAAAALLFVMVGRATPWSAGFTVGALAWLLLRGLALRGQPEPRAVQRSVGCMIRSLLLLQAGLCALMPETGLIPAIGLLIAWPLAALAGRMFYGS
jgi:4-hydroxybenzoate polyprenyltransferase